jgi:nucleoside-diphosphate-sugar epimerase
VVLLTGATGFVGAALIERLARMGDGRIRACTRDAGAVFPDAVETFVIGDLSGQTCWDHAFDSVSVVVHAAARVHVMNETAADPLQEFRRVNVDGTLHLARCAARAGVRRFVFISSIKVNGEATLPGQAFSESDVPAPSDPYGISKLEAEQGLFALAQETGMQVVVVRPPLVYGPGVGANFLSMMRWLRRGVPLPLGAIDNRRSLVALGNLADLVAVCAEHPAAANQVWLAADGEDLSTSQLLRRMGQALGKPARLLPVPAWMLGAACAVIGKRGFAQRLCGSLQVDISKARQLLGWVPPLSVDEGLRRAARGK